MPLRPSPTQPPSSSLADSFLIATPLLAIVLLMAVLAGVLWLAQADQAATQRQTLITDALWVEQALRFQLASDEDALTALAADTTRNGLDHARFLARAELLSHTSPEVRSVVVVSDSGEILAASPASFAAKDADTGLASLSRTGTARASYGLPRLMSNGTAVVDLVVPGPNRTTFIATILLPDLMTRQVPWWIAEKYSVALLSGEGRLLGEKSSQHPDKGMEAHDISFDPPVPGAHLLVTPYLSHSELAHNAVVGAVLVLALVVLVSLGVLQRDIQHRRRAEAQVRSEIAFRKSMEESLNVGMRARDFNGKIVYVNSAFCNMVGYEADELIGRAPPMPYWLPDLLDEVIARHDALNRSGRAPQSFETRFKHRDGHLLDILVYEAPLIDASGEHIGWMGSIIDMTERKRTQDLQRKQMESLTRTGRLVTLGEMATTLAHELSQPLAAISSYAVGGQNLLAEPEPDTAKIGAALERITTQAQRAGRVIRRIQDFVRKREPRFSEANLNEIIHGTIAFGDLGSRREGPPAEVNVPPGPVRVLVDRILIEQVLLNLIRNAYEAMANKPTKERRLAISVDCVDDFVITSLIDRGDGMDQATASALFTPFQTTKSEGMGMGLNICRTIIELHRGRIWYDEAASRALDHGSVFRFTLPLSPEAHDA